jgi:exodeoxyribonuclease VII small subunit
MSDPTCPAPDELTFGAALNELDKVVSALEGGQLELEASIEQYGRGVALLQSLQAKLAEAQQKVTMLIGELEEEAGGADAPAAPAAPAGTSSEEVPF